MSKIYDGKLTAWIDIEISKILESALPPVGKFYEGKNSFEIKTVDPRFNQTKDALIKIAREYASKETTDAYASPVQVHGGVHHGCEDD